MKLNVKLDKIDEELMYKRTIIKTGDKEIITPVKAGFKKSPLIGINEMYKQFSLEKLDRCNNDEAYERNTNREVKYQQSGETNFLIVDYSDIELPRRKHIETLSDIQYENSDVVITPTCSKITRELAEDSLLNSFKNITNEYIEIVRTMNNKTIIGVIPSRMPRQYLDNIINNYHDKDITSFVIDFDGRSIDTNPSWIRKLMKSLNNYDLIKEGFIYSLNSNEGKFLRNATEIVAKDFIATGFGIDIIGLNHIPPRLSSEAWIKIKQERRENTFRIFNRNSYGYIKKTESELQRMSIMNRDQLKNYNINEQYKESKTLQEKIKENDTIESYIKSKSQMSDEVIKKIKNLRKQTFS